MSYFVYDIDGTLANTEHRQHFVRPESGKKKDWRSFFDPDRMMLDEPHEAVFTIMAACFFEKGIVPVFCTGRPDNLREATLDWLNQFVPFSLTRDEINERLYMRPSNDHRDDSIVKPELVRQIIEKYGNPLAMFEDRNRVVAAVRAMGVTVFQVQEGNF